MLEELLADGSIQRVAMAVLVVAVGAVAERGWLALRWRPYFAAGVPLGQNPLPLPRHPDAKAGAVSGLCWELLADGAGAVWWTDPHGRGFPRGLHGVVWFERTARAVGLAVRWSPPWTPLLAMVWLAVVGALDGQGWLTGPLAAVLSIALFAGYHRQAVRAAAVLRFGWAREEDGR